MFSNSRQSSVCSQAEPRGVWPVTPPPPKNFRERILQGEQNSYSLPHPLRDMGGHELFRRLKVQLKRGQHGKQNIDRPTGLPEEDIRRNLYFNL